VSVEGNRSTWLSLIKIGAWRLTGWMWELVIGLCIYVGGQLSWSLYLMAAVTEVFGRNHYRVATFNFLLSENLLA